MEDIVKIVERDIVGKMNPTLQVLFINGAEIKVCFVKWARRGKTVTDVDNVAHIILSVNHAENIITLQTEPAEGDLVLEMPLFMHGTPREVNHEWTARPKMEITKVPAIWLVEPVEETEFGRESSLERESDLRLIFFDSRDGSQWLNKDIHEERTQSLLNLKSEFKQAIARNTRFKNTEQGRTRNLNKLGTESLSGFQKNIIDADLTALDHREPLLVYCANNCKC
jgi:hypothetical protein